MIITAILFTTSIVAVSILACCFAAACRFDPCPPSAKRDHDDGLSVCADRPAPHLRVAPRPSPPGLDPQSNATFHQDRPCLRGCQRRLRRLLETSCPTETSSDSLAGTGNRLPCRNRTAARQQRGPMKTIILAFGLLAVFIGLLVCLRQLRVEQPPPIVVPSRSGDDRAA